MPTINLTLPRRHEAQQHIVDTSTRFNVVACGRRFGKTTFGIDRCITPDVLSHPVGWFAPSYKLMIEVWREANRLLSPIISRRSIQERRLELVTGGVLEFWSLDNTDAGRGRKYKRVIIDEAGFVPNLLDVWQQAIRPTLADLEGDAYFLGTPKGRNGFWSLFLLGQDPERKEWSAFQMPTSANPHIAASEIEAMRLGLPDMVYQQEVLAAFLEDGAGVFRNVTRCVQDCWLDNGKEGRSYVFGVDWGKHNDFTVITVIDAESLHVVNVDRFNQIDYSFQAARLRALADRFNPTTVIAESNAMGDAVIERLVELGLPVEPFNTTNATKKAIIEKLALAFEREEIGIPDDPVLIGELRAFESERLPSGLIRYNAPSGMHDDMVMSLAMAYEGAGGAWYAW